MEATAAVGMEIMGVTAGMVEIEIDGECYKIFLI